MKDFLSFKYGDNFFAISSNRVQKVSKDITYTKVPGSKKYIAGIFQLNGIIITLLNLGILLNLKNTPKQLKNCIILKKNYNDYLGILTNSIEDIFKVNTVNEELPSTLNYMNTKFLNGIIKKDKKIILELNIDTILSIWEG